MAQHEYPLIAIDDYLMLDKNSTHARYEYLDGDLRMLAGGTPYHSAIIANLTIAIGRSLGENPCWIYNSDVQLQLSETCYAHPDLTISCDERDHRSEDVIQYPSPAIEVLSPGTEAVDKIKKLAYYQACATIQEYLMVDSRSIHIEVYSRAADGWIFHTYGPESVIKLPRLGIQFSIKDIYRGMNLTATRKNQKRDVE